MLNEIEIKVNKKVAGKRWCSTTKKKHQQCKHCVNRDGSDFQQHFPTKIPTTRPDFLCDPVALQSICYRTRAKRLINKGNTTGGLKKIGTGKEERNGNSNRNDRMNLI